MVTFPERSRSLDLYCIHVLLKSHQETGHSNFTLSWQSSSAEYNLCLHFDTFFLGVPQRSLHFCTSKANHEMHTFLHVLTINMHSYLWYFFSIASLIHEYHPSKKKIAIVELRLCIQIASSFWPKAGVVNPTEGTFPWRVGFYLPFSPVCHPITMVTHRRNLGGWAALVLRRSGCSTCFILPTREVISDQLPSYRQPPPLLLLLGPASCNEEKQNIKSLLGGSCSTYICKDTIAERSGILQQEIQPLSLRIVIQKYVKMILSVKIFPYPWIFKGDEY